MKLNGFGWWPRKIKPVFGSKEWDSDPPARAEVHIGIPGQSPGGWRERGGATHRPLAAPDGSGWQVFLLDTLLVIKVVGGCLCLHHFVDLGEVFVQSGQRLLGSVVDLAAGDLLSTHRHIGGVRASGQAAAVEFDLQLATAEVSLTIEGHVVEHEANGQRVVVADLVGLVFDFADDASAEVSAATQREFARIDETVREILGEGGGDGFVKIDGVHGLFPFEGGGAFPHPMKTILLRLLIKAIRETKILQ